MAALINGKKMRHNLPSFFYSRPTLRVARELLGKCLVRKHRGKFYYGLITETEAYCGHKDKASHASRGLTPRTKTMFGPPGHAYIYLIYGMYHCLNIVTAREGYPAAVLIRGVKIFTPNGGNIGRDAPRRVSTKCATKILNGPGRVCRHFHIDKSLNEINVTDKNSPLQIVDLGFKIKGGKIYPSPSFGTKWWRIKKSPRVGIDYAEEYRDKPWRFVLTP